MLLEKNQSYETEHQTMQSVIQARDEELQQLHKKSSDQLQYIQLLKQQLVHSILYLFIFLMKY